MVQIPPDVDDAYAKAEAFLRGGAFERARPMLEQVIARLEEEEGPGCDLLVEPLVQLSMVHRKADRQELAESYATRAAMIVEAGDDRAHPLLFQALGALTNAYVARGNLDGAFHLMRRALETCARRDGQESLNFAALSCMAGGVCVSMRGYAAAVTLFERAVRIIDKRAHDDDRSGGNGDPNADLPDADERLAILAKSLHGAGVAHFRLDHREKAATFLERALVCFEAAFGAHHPETIAALDDLAAFFEAIGEPTKAKAYASRVQRTRGN